MKFITSLVFICFSFVNVFAPAVVFAGTTSVKPVVSTSYKPVSLSDSSNPTLNLGYVPSVPTLASTTWQKSYDQTVNVQASDVIKNIALQNVTALIQDNCPGVSLADTACAKLIKNNTFKVAMYLVPTYSPTPLVPASNSNCNQSTSLYYLNDVKNNRGVCLQYPSTAFSNYIMSGQFQFPKEEPSPSFALYAPPANGYGYFIGYANYVYGGSKSSPEMIFANNATSTSIDSMDFAWVPLGSYKLFTAIGYATTTSITTFKATLPGLGNPGSVFSIATPEVAYSQLPSPIVYKQPVFTEKSEPYYPTSVSPLPQSVSRPVSILYQGTGKTLLSASANEDDIILGSISTSIITVTPAPDPEMIITSPFGDNIIWQKNVNHDITWIANFRRSNDNDTGIHTWDGITYNHGGTVDNYNSGGAIAGRIVLSFVPVVGQVIGIVLSILDLFGVFDDTSAPFAVTQVVTITPFSTSTNSYTGSPYLLANTFVENAKVTVSLASIPDGVYVLQAKALVGTTNVIATSSPFTLTSGGSVTTTNLTSSSSTSSIFASTTPIITTTTIIASTSLSASTSSTTRVTSPTITSRPIPPTASTTVLRLTPLTQNPPAQNNQNRPSAVSVPASISSYVCPTNYILTQNSLCRIMSSAGQPRQHSLATTSQQMMIPATPVYTCPNSFNLNTVNNTCTKPVSYQIQDVPQESMMANVINTLDTMLRILSL